MNRTPDLTARSAVRAVGALLLVGIVLPFVATGMPAVVGAEHSYVVLSGSMEPAIEPGDAVLVDSVDPSTIERGDVITYRRGAGPVTHRVVEVRTRDGERAFRTKGDANEEPDPQLVPADRVVGRVLFVLPFVGHVVGFTDTTEGFVALVLLPLGLLVLSEAWDFAAATDGAGADRAPGSVATEATGTERGESAGLALAPATLGRAAAVLGPLAALTGYLAYTLRSVWAVAAFYAAFGVFCLTGALYAKFRWAGGGAESEAVPPSESADDDRNAARRRDDESDGGGEDA